MIGGGAVSLLIILYAFVVDPFYSSYIQMKKDIPVSYRKLKLYENMLHGIPTVKKELESVTKQYEALENKVLSGDKPAVAAANLQALLQTIAKKDGIGIEKIKVLKFNELEKFTEIPVRVSFKSPLDTFTQYVRKVENNDKILIIKEVKLRSLKTDSKEKLDATLDVVGFIFK